ncbi:MAG: transcriptional regulator [Candidatus Bipolaricaulota bacterium]|nr:transcriptional regulator [Candidatus Bipolaricaulota bacterium]
MRKEKESPRLEIDRVIHEPARLILVAHLYVVESADVVFLMQSTGLTWGNLSSHLSKLEEADYIETVKDFVDRKPHTMVKLTKAGRSAFDAYRRQMKGLFADLPS